MKDDRVYLIHVLECIEQIEHYTEDGAEAFFSDTKTQDAVLRNLPTLSESTQRLSLRLKSAHPEVDWRGISGFRNIKERFFRTEVKRACSLVYFSRM